MVGQKYKLTKDMKEAADALQLSLADAAITLRQIYADAPGQGTVVWRMGTKGKKRPGRSTRYSYASNEPHLARFVPSP